MEKILVTGSEGFIGKEIVKRLKKNELIQDKIGTKRVNLQNFEEVMKIKKADIVIHLASKTKKSFNWEEYFNNNVSGTLNI